MASPSQGSIPLGQERASSTWGDYNQQLFVIGQEIAKLQTSTLVRVVSCTNDGGLSPVGYVDVVPLVNQIDGAGIGKPHTTIFNVPYFRMQGGANAVIIDPKEGDIGMCAFASRDITKVKRTRAAANPGSLRRYSFADAMYMGGFLNGAPTQYVQFSDDGIKLVSPVAVDIVSPTLTHNGVNIGDDHKHAGSATAPNGPVSNTGDPI